MLGGFFLGVSETTTTTQKVDRIRFTHASGKKSQSQQRLNNGSDRATARSPKRFREASARSNLERRPGTSETPDLTDSALLWSQQQCNCWPHAFCGAVSPLESIVVGATEA